MTEFSDEIIMNRVKQGNLSELSILFDRYHVRLYNYFLKLTFNKAISQDLTQNLFYRVLKYRHTFRDDSRFKPWVYQMARNAYFDHFKEQKRTFAREVNVENYETNLAEQNDRFGEEEFERLDKSLSKLNHEQLELIVLSRFQGLNYEEIATMSNSTVGAIKVQMHRTMKKLREIYFKQE